jgi:hypothetical protein
MDPNQINLRNPARDTCDAGDGPAEASKAQTLVA